MTIRFLGSAFARPGIVLKYANIARTSCCALPGFTDTSASTCQTAGNLSKRHYAQAKRKEVVQSKTKGSSDVTVSEKVKQAGKDATYGSIVVIGVGVTGLIFYTIGKELFSSQSPNGVYDRALKLCKNNDEIVDSLGEPMKGYGETNRRGRRRHVSHMLFERDGVPCMRMKFYVEGPFNKGTVHLEVRQNDRGKYEYRYLYVVLENHPRKTIVLEDNRSIVSV